MAFDTPPNIGDQRRKALMRRLGAQGHGFMPMPGNGSAAGAEGRAFRGVGNVRSFPRTATTHASQVLAGVLANLGAGGHPGRGSEVSPGNGMAIAPPPRVQPPMPPIAPPIPVPQTPNVIPHPSSGDTYDPGAGGSTTPYGPGAGGGSPVAAPGDSGGFNTPSAPISGGISANLNGGQPNVIPLGSGLYYDPSTDTVMGSGSSAGGAARRF